MEYQKAPNPLFKKLKGYQKAPRDRFKLLSEGFLTIEEFVVYEALIALVDWDLTHDTYGTFQATNAQIAEVLGWKDDSIVSRYRKSLIQKGFLFPKEGHRFEPRFFFEFELRKGKSAIKQDDSAQLQQDFADMQKDSAKTQVFYPQKQQQALVSSKYYSSFTHLVNSKSLPSELEKYTSEELIDSYETAEARGEV